MLRGRTLQLSARAIRAAYSTARWLTTGSAPGCARHLGQVCVLGSSPLVTSQAQNIVVRVSSSTGISSPITGSQALIPALPSRLERRGRLAGATIQPVSYTHLRAHE